MKNHHTYLTSCAGANAETYVSCTAVIMWNRTKLGLWTGLLSTNTSYCISRAHVCLVFIRIQVVGITHCRIKIMDDMNNRKIWRTELIETSSLYCFVLCLHLTLRICIKLHVLHTCTALRSICTRTSCLHWFHFRSTVGVISHTYTWPSAVFCRHHPQVPGSN